VSYVLRVILRVNPTMSPVTVRVTTLVFGPVKFDRVIQLVHYIELAVTVVNRQQPLARYSSWKACPTRRVNPMPMKRCIYTYIYIYIYINIYK